MSWYSGESLSLPSSLSLSLSLSLILLFDPLAGWKKRNHISERRANNIKAEPIESRVAGVLSWHCSLRRLLNRPNLHVPVSSLKTCFGRFPLWYRWNTDQVPGLFSRGNGKTLAETGTRRVKIVLINDGKRFATLQVTIPLFWLTKKEMEECIREVKPYKFDYEKLKDGESLSPLCAS